MKRPIKIIYLGLILSILAGTWGCKSSKKVTETKTTDTEEVRKDPEEEKKEEVTTMEEEKKTRDEKMKTELNSYFEKISTASSPEVANRNISLAMNMFSDKEAPVFVVFYTENGQKDYDKPTTIDKHLNYLKDQKKNPYKIDRLIYGDDGKIAEIELTSR